MNTRPSSLLVVVCLVFSVMGAAGEEQAEADSKAEADPKAEAPAIEVERPAPSEPFWANLPPVEKFPRPGHFVTPPTGPGYYSLWDVLRGDYREAPPQYAYPRFALMHFSFFNADWRYLDKPDYKDQDFFDPLKRIHLGDDWLFTTGGEFRYRYNNEVDSRLTGVDNVYDLTRVRVYGDLWYRDIFRIYAEYLDAQIFNNDLPPQAIDADRSDFLNLFADLKVCEVEDKPVYFRAGRQELLYGSQRFISPLDWANTRRTFQGLKTFRQGEKIDVDLFIVQPMIPDPSNFNSPDYKQIFTGLWTTYRPQEGQSIDMYYLNLDQARALPPVLGIPLAPFNVSTIGGRYVGEKDKWRWEMEGAVQFGQRASQGVLANMTTVGLGRYFKCCPWDPQLWVYYDYASGDDNPGVGGTSNTFNQLFPFGHYYLGFIDLVSRQNIHDFNTQLALYPTKWTTVLFQFHVFRLASPTDALYNDAGTPIRRDASGKAGIDVGEELDIKINFHLGKHQDLLFGYSHLYAGEFIKLTGPPNSPDFTYVQYNFRW